MDHFLNYASSLCRVVLRGKANGKPFVVEREVKVRGPGVRACNGGRGPGLARVQGAGLGPRSSQGPGFRVQGAGFRVGVEWAARPRHGRVGGAQARPSGGAQVVVVGEGEISAAGSCCCRLLPNASNCFHTFHLPLTASYCP